MNALSSSDRRYVPVAQASTDDVGLDERLRYWEAYTASALIGVRCSSFASEGLNARQRNFDLGELRLAEISGNEHVVERTPTIMRRHPKDSVFASLLVRGEAFLYQSGRCIPVRAGDLIVYTTTTPYLYGVHQEACHVQIDIAFDQLMDASELPASFAPIRIEGGLQAGRQLVRPLGEDMLSFVDQPLAARAPDICQQLRSSLDVILRAYVLERSSGADVRLIRAERFIAANLCDPELDAESVAHHLSMSLRTLSRVFERSGCSATQWIWRERLDRAQGMLVDPKQSSLGIGDIALQCGFATQAHFARVFKERFGRTPSEHRAESH